MAHSLPPFDMACVSPTRHPRRCLRAPPAVELRLAGGVPGKSGRLEIKYNGVWGTVRYAAPAGVAH